MFFLVIKSYSDSNSFFPGEFPSLDFIHALELANGCIQILNWFLANTLIDFEAAGIFKIATTYKKYGVGKS
jgi:hypothetical protein